jgi:hypothetical protein
MGHIASKDGREPDPKKVQPIVGHSLFACMMSCSFGTHQHLYQVDSGLRKSDKASDCLKQKHVSFDWKASCAKAFSDLKHALTTAPVLALSDPSKPFELVCGASRCGIRAVLLQNERPVADCFRKMTAAQRNYVVTEQELMATVGALCVFHCYLLSGQPFTWSLTIYHTPFCKLSSL